MNRKPPPPAHSNMSFLGVWGLSKASCSEPDLTIHLKCNKFSLWHSPVQLPCLLKRGRMRIASPLPSSSSRGGPGGGSGGCQPPPAVGGSGCCCSTLCCVLKMRSSGPKTSCCGSEGLRLLSASLPFSLSRRGRAERLLPASFPLNILIYH